MISPLLRVMLALLATTTWDRDQLGFYSPAPGVGEAHCIAKPLTPGPDASVYLNHTGVGEHSRLAVDVLDEQFRPIPGYTAEACVPENDRSGGLRVPVTWGGRETLGEIDQPVRLRINFTGVRPEDIRFDAAYVE